MKIKSEHSILGLKLDNMSLEAKRLYVTIKLISERRPKDKEELLEEYNSSINELEKKYLATGEDAYYDMAEQLIDMRGFINENVEEIDIDGFNKINWGK